MTIKIYHYTEEIEYDEGGCHYICFARGEIGAIDDDYSLPEDLAEKIKKLSEDYAEFERFRAYNITKNYDAVKKLLKKYNIGFIEVEV